jgi:hypothetical protein
MPPSSPSDLFWTALSPLVQQLEALGRVLEVCATYYAWCAGCAAGVAFLLLGGLVVAEATEDRGGPTFMANVPSRIRNWIDAQLRRLSMGPSEAAPPEQ